MNIYVCVYVCIYVYVYVSVYVCVASSVCCVCLVRALRLHAMRLPMHCEMRNSIRNCIDM